MSLDKKHLIVAYHQDCIDGLASAWAVGKKYEDDKAAKITYVPYGHHRQDVSEEQILQAAQPGSEILFVDAAPRPDFLKKLLSSHASLVRVIDHHKSAMESLSAFKAPNLQLDMDANHPSAALMVWERMHPGTPAPDFIRMIARMDVQTDLRTPHDFAVAAYIDSKSIRSIEDAFRSFSDLSAMTLNEMTLEGSGLYRDQYNRITKLGDNVMYTQLPHHEDLRDVWIPVVNADVQNFGRSISQYLRELGQKTGADMAFAWYMQGNGKITMSIRSDGAPDASHVARHLCEQHGAQGGGHGTSAAVHFDSLAEFSASIRLSQAAATEPKAAKAAKNKPS